jgi:hypothetical protein
MMATNTTTMKKKMMMMAVTKRVLTTKKTLLDQRTMMMMAKEALAMACPIAQYQTADVRDSRTHGHTPVLGHRLPGTALASSRMQCSSSSS